MTYLSKEKAELRTCLRKRRQALSVQQQQQASIKILEVLKTMPVIQSSLRIAVYVAFDGEIDLSLVVQWLWHLEKQCYLPVVNQVLKHQLRFMSYRPTTQLQKNCFGILEPDFFYNSSCKASELDLVLIPVTGFDSSCKRLGMGAGFYDRTFQHIAKNTGPFLLGVAHECQKIESLPANSLDLPMHAIATDKQLYFL